MPVGPRCAISVALLVLMQPAASPSGRPPTIELDAPSCVRPAVRPRICARIFDDRSITRARALFRARGKEPFYWTEMRFDGSRYCAWLPLPSKKTRSIDLYVDAVDDEYGLSRTREVQLSIEAGCAAEPPAAPEGPTCIGTTTPRQQAKPKGFEAATLTDGC
jgi:hypothetical protein